MDMNVLPNGLEFTKGMADKIHDILEDEAALFVKIANEAIVDALDEELLFNDISIQVDSVSRELPQQEVVSDEVIEEGEEATEEVSAEALAALTEQLEEIPGGDLIDITSLTEPVDEEMEGPFEGEAIEEISPEAAASLVD